MTVPPVLGSSPDKALDTAARPEPAREGDSHGSHRIGILGGTFDPPHVGHLWLASLAADAMALDRVIFMPAPQPPHKHGRDISPIVDRLLMTRLAIGGNDLFELTTLEVGRAGPSYTVDSVVELLRTYDDAALFLIMSADSLAQIDTWHEPDRLLSLLEWVVGPRPGTPLPDPERLRQRFGAAAERIHLLEGPSLDVSATEIRRRVAAGRTIRYLVPQAVEELIIERGLYRRPRQRGDALGADSSTE
ncbi:MAG TPA: nicotinate-nucleotide adenylyltransferase [Candidatus Limnocylindria bacterium]|nr:nicotinate-nucleotide adenylyltransferase [Candidatus Limnocylindria bacterium]